MGFERKSTTDYKSEVLKGKLGNTTSMNHCSNVKE